MASMLAKLWTRLCAKRIPMTIMIVGLDNSGKTSILNYLKSENLDVHNQNQSSSSTLRAHSSPTSNTVTSQTIAAGKTSGAENSRHNGGDGNVVTPTSGYNYEKIQYKNVTITVLDFSGQNRYRNLWQEFYNSVDGLVFVVDSSDLISLASDQQQSGTHSVQSTYPVASELVQKQITISQGKLIQSPLDEASSISSSSIKNKITGANQNCPRRRTKVPILFMANKTDLPSSVDTEVVTKALNLSQLPLERHPWFIQATSVTLGQGVVEGFDWLVRQLAVN